MTGSPPDDYYRRLEDELWACDSAVKSLLPQCHSAFAEYIDVGEYGLAFDEVAEDLATLKPGMVGMDLARRLLVVADLMEVRDERVAALERWVSAG